MYDKLLSLLGLARRAGKLALGFEAAVQSADKGNSSLLITAGDLSERSKRAVAAAAERNRTEMIALDIPMSRIGEAVGKQTGIISVNDAGFARKLKTLCNE